MVPIGKLLASPMRCTKRLHTAWRHAPWPRAARCSQIAVRPHAVLRQPLAD